MRVWVFFNFWGKRAMKAPPAADSTQPATRPSALRREIERMITPNIARDLYLGDAATVNVQFWIGQFPWRLTSGWSLLAALLASGLVWRPLDLAWRDLVLLWLLVDPMWGALWRLAGGRGEQLRLHGRTWATEVWLPYLRRGSPAAQLLGGDGPASLPLLFRVALPGVLVALLTASALGLTALWMTGTVTLLSAIGWIMVRQLHRPPALLHSLVMVGLPWLLTLSLTGAVDSDGNVQLTLAALWTLHAWGGARAICYADDWPGLALLAVAQIGIGVALVVAQSPLWLAALVILWLPTWLAVYQRRSLRRQRIWWLAAMLVSALALGQTL